MRWLRLPLLFFLASCCLAQDGISPDTLLTWQSGFISYTTRKENDYDTIYYIDEISSDAYTGVFYTEPCTSFMAKATKDGDGTCLSIATNMYEPVPPFVLDTTYAVYRSIYSFNTVGVIGALEELDSCVLSMPMVWEWVISTDGDCLWTVQFVPRCSSDCEEAEDSGCLLDLCNFYRCGEKTFLINNDIDKYAEITKVDSPWLNIEVDTALWDNADTTIVGLVTRRAPGADPTGYNHWETQNYVDVGDSVGMLIYWFSDKVFNDISHQDNADGISPDTIQFICSVAFDEISTPGFWSAIGYYWNGEPGPGAPGSGGDAFRGPDNCPAWPSNGTVWFTCWGCDTSGCGVHNYAMQPLVEASFYGSGYNIYWMRRAYFLMELEESIPDTTELDSMRFYLRFANVDIAEGDSLFIVTYTPRDTDGGGCVVNYHGSWWDINQEIFRYPVIYGGYPQPPSRWCNHYQCGDHKIWGDIPDRSHGRVPQYLGWTWFPIHPDIIDFHAASVGDTFGVGLILKDEYSQAPTDTNVCSIMDGVDCPYIVYYFSPPEPTAGFINWGLRPPHLGWGLPINQARGMFGGGKGR